MPGIASQCESPASAASAVERPAAFVDRDGTLVADAHYLSSADQLQLIPGASDAIRSLNDAGIPVIIVTNQSGIARGYFTAAQYCAVERALTTMLRDEGAFLTATYHCPHLPEISGACACRKPGPALFQRAARDHALALDRSLYVGDRWRDAAPALLFGGTGVLVPAPATPIADRDEAIERGMLANSLEAAVGAFIRGGR